MNLAKINTWAKSMVLIAAASTSCSKFTKLLHQSSSVEKDRNLSTSGNPDGSITSTASSSYVGTQHMSGTSESGTKDVEIAIPPGSLSIDSRITMAAGDNLATSELANSLGASTGFTSSSSSVTVSSSPAQDLKSPMSLSIPLPASSGLRLADTGHLVLLYETYSAVTKTYATGILPGAKFVIGSGKATVTVLKFGTYQLAYASTVISAEIVKSGTAKAIMAGNGADTTAPVPANSGILSLSATSSTVAVTWTAATDNTTSASDLQYRVYYSTSDNIGSASTAQANGTAANSWTTNITSLTLSSLNASTTYYVNVLVKDAAGNVASYTSKAQATSSAPDTAAPTISSSALSFNSVTTTGFTVTWATASDNVDAASALQYRVYTSSSNNITNSTDASTNGTARNSWTANIASLAVSGLSATTTYYVNVLVKDTAGNISSYTSTSIATASVVDSTAPVAGSSGGLSFSATTTSGFTVSWTAASDNITSAANLQYAVYYSTSNNIGAASSAETNGTQAMTWIANTTSYVFTSLAQGTNYYINVLVRDEAGNKVGYTSSMHGTIPGDPSSLSVSGLSSVQLDLNWTASGGNTNGYKIAYNAGSTAPSDCTSGTILTATVSPKTITGLTTNTSYAFRVCSSNGTDLSGGVTVSATTLQSAPPNPSAFSAAVDSSSQITLSWTSGGGSTSSYIIAYQSGSTAPSTCSSGTTTTSSTASKSISGLTSATQYSFRVCAANSNPTPDVSIGVTVTATTPQAPPPDPTGLNATVISDTQITLNWTSGGGSTATYKISYLPGASAPSTCTSGTVVTSSSPSTAVTGLAGGTQYSFRVCALNGNTTPDMSTGVTVSATTNVTPPGDVTLSAPTISDTQIALSWTAGSGATGTQIAYQKGGTAPADCTTTAAGITIIGSATINNATTYTITSLVSGQPYAFRVCAVKVATSTFASGVTTALMTTMSVATIFATNNTYSGNLGGISGADSTCVNAANAVPLSAGTWRAVLSDNTSSGISARTRLAVQGTVVNRNPTPQTIASSRASFWGGTLSYGVGYSETGTPISSNAWTGILSTGLNAGSSSSCNHFVDATSSYMGAYGSTSSASSAAFYSATIACNSTTQHLYCLSQPNVNPLASFTGTAGASAGIVSLTISFPSDTSGYGSVEIRRTTDALTAMNGDCSSGTLFSTLTTFANTTISDTNGSAGTYSYEACVKDLNGNRVSSTPLLNVMSGGVSHQIFVTNASYAGNIGSVTAGNTNCATAASAAGLTGVWKALLSDSANPASTNVTISGPVYNLNSQMVASAPGSFWGGWAFGVTYTETLTATGSMSVWTGSTPAGANSGSNCSNWTSPSSGSATIGSSNATGASGINQGSTLPCSSSAKLYCVK